MIASKQGDPFGIAVDATSVYRSSRVDAAVTKAPRAGGPSTVLYAGSKDPDYPDLQRGVAVAVDGTSVYWVASRTSSSSGMIMKAPLAGGPPVVLASDQIGPVGLVVSGENVFWINAGTMSSTTADGASSGDGAVMKARVDGTGAPVALVPHVGSPEAIAVSGDHVYRIDGGGGPGQRAQLPPANLLHGRRDRRPGAPEWRGAQRAGRRSWRRLLVRLSKRHDLPLHGLRAVSRIRAGKPRSDPW